MSRYLRLECRSSSINRKTAHQTGEPGVVRALGTPRMPLHTVDWRNSAIRCRSCEDGCGLLLGHACSTPLGAMPGSALRKEARIERCEFSHHRAFPPATRRAAAIRRVRSHDCLLWAPTTLLAFRASKAAPAGDKMLLRQCDAGLGPLVWKGRDGCRSTPMAVTPTGLLVRAQTGSLVESAAWATNQQSRRRLKGGRRRPEQQCQIVRLRRSRRLRLALSGAIEI